MAIAAQVDETTVQNIQPNILDNFDQVTYHLNLFMLEVSAFQEGDFFNNDRRIIIAESGVTGVSIDNLTILSTVGITDKAQAGFALNFNFTLIQPFGADLIDRIFAASIELGIENYAKYPFFLELSFRGRDPDGSLPLGMDSRELEDLVWVWPIHILKMDIGINEEGSTYQCEAVIDSNIAYSDQHGMIDKSVSIEARTFGEFASRLSSDLSIRAQQTASLNGTVPDEYEIVSHGDIPGALIVPVSKSEDPSRERDFLNITIKGSPSDTDRTNEASDSSTTIQFHRGIDIVSAITAVLSSTSRFQNSIKNTDESSDIGPARKDTFKELFRITTETEIIRYDDRRGDYARRYTYHVVPYSIARLIASQKDLDLSKSEQNRRYNDLRRNKSLNKIYRYIYTGQNDQILEFELAFNMAWFAATPLLVGFAQQYYSSDTGSQARQTPQEKIEAERRAATASDQFAQAVLRNRTVQSEQEDSLALPSPGVEEAREIQRFEQLGSIRPIFSTRNTPTETDAQRVGTDPIPGNLPPNSRLVGRQTPPRNIRFAEDLSLEQTLQAIQPGVTRNRDLPISHLPYQTGHLTNYGVESSFHRGRTLFSALFSQALSAYNNDLIKIEMRIKGDPYWLEPKPIRRGDTTSRTFDPNAKPDDVSTFYATLENYFLFQTQVPREPNSETGLVSGFDNKSIINGVYSVITVEHTFADGQFTQTIQGQRDPITQVSEIQDIGQ